VPNSTGLPGLTTQAGLNTAMRSSCLPLGLSKIATPQIAALKMRLKRSNHLPLASLGDLHDCALMRTKVDAAAHRLAHTIPGGGYEEPPIPFARRKTCGS
jgi:hypothetical protein